MKENLRKEPYAVKVKMKGDLHFAERLKELMRAKGINASDLARAINFSHVAVGYWLRGSKPTAETARKIANYFGVSLEALLFGPKYVKMKGSLAEASEAATRVEEASDPGNVAFNEIALAEERGAREAKKEIASELRQVVFALQKLADSLDPSYKALEKGEGKP